MAGKKRAKIFYNHNNVECKKMKFKKRPENFLVSHECRKQKNDVKNAWQIFWRFSRISRAKKWWEKTREYFFQDPHEYREQKNGGIKNARKIFYNHNNVENKKWILRNAPKIFLDSNDCREQKMVLKKRVRNFLKILTNIGAKKLWEKKRAKFFLKILTNIGNKMAGKKRAKLFSRFSRISRAKKGREKTREKFFIITIMSRAKKWF